ncbi:PREDICTED: translation initiation factor IF-2-like [Rhinopithecus bieti]|uniref:translation initiation factor IF-2-like n=1 Tax=Rhinopithecus bieti TaxID=61621 RepID=UPI00083C8F3D|nr:PREDICTED: translation initiation factor IF-2-like [Rhinopithecus bieti]
MKCSSPDRTYPTFSTHVFHRRCFGKEGSGRRRSRRCKPVWLRCRVCGDGASGWREKGKSLGGRRAGPAASPAAAADAQPALSAPRLGSGAHQAGTRARARGAPLLLLSVPGPRTRRGEAAPGRGAARSCWALAAARCSVWPKDRRGRKGKAGTHTLAAARAHCILVAARPRQGASGASLAPRLQPRHLPAPSAAPGPGPTRRPLRAAVPPAPRMHCSPFAVGKRQRPDNLQTVAQLVLVAEAPECCPGETD